MDPADIKNYVRKASPYLERDSKNKDFTKFDSDNINACVNKRLIVVLGMHRSGSSVITCGLNVIGVNLGKKLQPGRADNPKGFFEDIDLVVLDTEMLQAIGSDWHVLAPIEPGDVDSLCTKGFFLRAVELLRDKTENVSIFGLKDPRMAKLLPFWHPVFVHCGFDIEYVLTIRNPLSVAQSLAKRDGFRLEKSYMLWLGHMLTSLLYTGPHKRIIVDYDHFLSAPQQSLELIAERFALQIDHQELQYYLSEILDIGLRHTVFALNDLTIDQACSPLVYEVYAALLDASSNSTRIDDAVLEHWVEEFDRLKSTLRLVDDLSGQVTALEQMIRMRDEEVAYQLGQAAVLAEAKLNELAESETGFTQQLLRIQQEHEQQINEQDRKHAEREQGYLNQLTSVRQQLQAKLNELAESETGFTQQLLRIQQEHEQQINEQDRKHAEREQGYLNQLTSVRQQLEAYLIELAEREKGFSRQLLQIQQAHAQQINERDRQHTERERMLYEKLLTVEKELRDTEQIWIEKLAIQERGFIQEVQSSRVQIDKLMQEQLQKLAAAAEREQTLLERLFTTESGCNIREQEGNERLAQGAAEVLKFCKDNAILQKQLQEQIHAVELVSLELQFMRNFLQREIAEIKDSFIRRITRPFRKSMEWHNPLQKPLSREACPYNHIATEDILPLPGKDANIHHPAIKGASKTVPMIDALHSNKSVTVNSLDEILALGDEAFVYAAYRAVLGRHPDSEGFAYYLNRIRSGVGKLEILGQLRASKEGAKYAANVPGLNEALKRDKWRRLPYLGWLARLMQDYRMKQIHVIENQVFAFQAAASRKLEDIDKLVASTQRELSGIKELLARTKQQVHDDYVFDADYYLQQNPDVAESGMNPYEHWIIAGRAEGRKCAPDKTRLHENADAVTAALVEANGVWEWSDYSVVKSRIDEIKLSGRSTFTSHPVLLIELGQEDFTTFAAQLKFPELLQSPDVSIVIPVFNNLALSLECLASIQQKSGVKVIYEIIIADDRSSDETSVVLSTIPNLRYMRNDSNLGFLRNCNQALAHAKGNYVIFLNNDVQVGDNWLETLLRTFTEHPQVGAVGPRFLYPNGYMQEVGGSFRLDGTTEMIGLNDDPSLAKYSYPRKVDYVSGACLMLPTALAVQLGGFSEDYLPCYCEDSDLCLRVREAGYFVYVNPAATVIHHLSKTTAAIDNSFKMRSVTKNTAILCKKWLPHIYRQASKIIAFYLPQFYPFPENNRWWGEGFTDWSNVAKAKANFAGHYQPRMPSDLGYYDLRLHNVMKEQAELASRYGVSGFCFYYYWFGGQRLLDLPIEQMLKSGEPNFPFCLCWANENWTRRWDGKDHEILMAQSHSRSDDVAVINDLMRFFRDERYIKIDGRPLLLIYRVSLFPNFLDTVMLWRSICREQGVGDIYVAMVESFELVHAGVHPKEYGCDAAVEFPPQGLADQIEPSGPIINPEFIGSVADYRDLAVRYATREQPNYTRFMGVMPGWDNTARRQNNGFCFEQATPGAFQAWLEETLERTRTQHYGDERLVFVNAWNEWAEGAYLEPDRRFGHSFLTALSNALESPNLLRRDLNF